jgi:hypothetical protein
VTRGFGYDGDGDINTPRPQRVYGIAGKQSTVETIGEYIGAIDFDPADFADDNALLSIVFTAVLWCTSSGQTCTLRIKNAANDTISTLTATETIPTKKTSSNLTVPANLAATSTTYELWLYRTAGAANEDVFCSLAYLKVSSQ